MSRRRNRSGDARIQRATSRLFASSIRAQKFKNGASAIQEVLTRLQGPAGSATKVQSADQWPAWRDQVVKNKPTLLVLLPHTDIQDDNEVLEIGDGNFLTNAQIDHRVVGSAHPVVVLLLGCGARPSRSLRFASFVASFRHAKAAIVIGTLTPVLGRHAAPIAARLVEQLDAL